MIKKILPALLSVAVSFSLTAAEAVNLIQNPNVTAREPGRYTHWAKASATIKNIENGIELLPEVKGKRAVIFQKMLPAPEKDYIFTCEFFISPESSRSRVYLEEQRYDKNKKIRFKTFTYRGKFVPGKWMKIEIPVKLAPGWKDFYVAVITEGGSCKVRNMFFTRKK